MDHFLLDQREALLAAESPLYALARREVRFVYRATVNTSPSRINSFTPCTCATVPTAACSWNYWVGPLFRCRVL